MYSLSQIHPPPYMVTFTLDTIGYQITNFKNQIDIIKIFKGNANITRIVQKKNNLSLTLWY